MTICALTRLSPAMAVARSRTKPSANDHAPHASAMTPQAPTSASATGTIRRRGPKRSTSRPIDGAVRMPRKVPML